LIDDAWKMRNWLEDSDPSVAHSIDVASIGRHSVESPFHVGIASPDVDALIRSLGPALGLKWVRLPRPPISHDTPTGPVSPSSQVVWSSEGPLHIELVKSEPGTAYRPELGTHVHHVGYWTDDIPGAVAALERQGWALEVTINDDQGMPSTFAYLSRAGDVWIELVDAAGRAWLQALLVGEVSP
jgi:hypothetical protein